MKGGSMLQRLRQISISSSLRGAFLMGALLTLIVSSVSLYSWHEQSSQIRYSLDEYFPRIHSAFLIEGNLNLVVDQLNEFLLAPNTTVRLQLRNQIIQHLDKIERLSQGLSPAETPAAGGDFAGQPRAAGGTGSRALQHVSGT
ncbi:Phosphoglycerate transport system sensor protein pgtB [Citrobacter koseri]|nr:Phosphoglycerate transport system sensor protein pgtB [Citrobacter koseri]SUX65454.1 Phosphoglycerate transport system sensor protein pgtB [Citrobacter koseri]